MKRHFVTNLILLVGLNLLVKPFYLLVIEAGVQNAVGEETFGNYFALINLSIMFNILLDLGISNWNTREVARGREGFISNLKPLLKLKVGLFLLYITVIAGLVWIANYHIGQLELIAILLLNQFLSSMILFLRSYLMGMHLFKADSLISVLDRFLLIAMMAALLLCNSTFDIMWFAWGQTIAYGLTAIWALKLVWKHKPLNTSSPSITNKEILKSSMPFAVFFTLSMIAYRIDGVLLERLHPNGAFQAGVYAMGFRLFEAFNMVAYLFAILLLPIFSKLISEHADVEGLLKTGYRVMLTGIVLFVSITIFNAHGILEIIYTNPDAQAANTLKFLVLGCAGFSMQYIFGTLLTANGNMRTLIFIAIGSVILNVMLNLILIPLKGAEGSAIANAITNVSVLIVQVIAVYRIFKFRIDTSLLLRSLLFVGIAITLAWAGASFFWLETIFNVPFSISLSVSALLIGISALATGVLDINQLPQLLRIRKEVEENKPGSL